MNALFGSLKRAASVASLRGAPLLAEASAGTSAEATTSTLLRTTAASLRSFSASSSSSDDEGAKAFTASLFPGDGRFFRFFLLMQIARCLFFGLGKMNWRMGPERGRKREEKNQHGDL